MPKTMTTPGRLCAFHRGANCLSLRMNVAPGHAEIAVSREVGERFPVHFDYEDVEHNSVSSAMSSVARPSSCARNSANETRSTRCENHARSRRLFRSNRDHERSGLRSAGRSLFGLSAGYFQIAPWALLNASASWKLAQPGVQVFGTISH